MTFVQKSFPDIRREAETLLLRIANKEDLTLDSKFKHDILQVNIPALFANFKEKRLVVEN